MTHFYGRVHRRRDSREARGMTAAAEPAHDEIARLAYAYWEAGGRRDGSSLEDWLRAERDLRERAAGAETYW